jgi:hypothetical protein
MGGKENESWRMKEVRDVFGLKSWSESGKEGEDFGCDEESEGVERGDLFPSIMELDEAIPRYCVEAMRRYCGARAACSWW